MYRHAFRAVLISAALLRGIAAIAEDKTPDSVNPPRELPKEPNEPQNGALVVSVNQDNSVTVDGKRFSDEELFVFLKEKAANDADLGIRLVVAVSLPYRRIVTVQNGCRSVGIKRISLKVAPDNPAGKTADDAVLKTWRETYPGAKILSQKQAEHVLFIEASDAMNEKFVVVLTAEGAVLTQSSKKVTLDTIPPGIKKKVDELRASGMTIDETLTTEKSDGRPLRFTLTGTSMNMPYRITFDEPGVNVEFVRIQTPDEQKAQAEVEAKEPPPVKVALVLNKDGATVLDGKSLTDAELSTALKEKSRAARLAVEITLTAPLPEGRVEKVFEICSQAHLKSFRIFPFMSDKTARAKKIVADVAKRVGELYKKDAEWTARYERDEDSAMNEVVAAACSVNKLSFEDFNNEFEQNPDLSQLLRTLISDALIGPVDTNRESKGARKK